MRTEEHADTNNDELKNGKKGDWWKKAFFGIVVVLILIFAAKKRNEIFRRLFGLEESNSPTFSEFSSETNVSEGLITFWDYIKNFYSLIFRFSSSLSY